MTTYSANTADGYSRQHNGDVINNNVVIRQETSFFNTLSQQERDMRLVQAAENGQIRRMKLLVDAHADVDYHGPDGETALHQAVDHGYQDCVELLLHSGADINALNKYGWTPLYLAVTKGDSAMINLLIEKRADLNIVDSQFRVSPLSWAAANGNVEVVDFLIKTRLVDLESRDAEEQNTPLLRAAMNGHQEIVDLLLAAGANAHSRNSQNRDYLRLLQMYQGARSAGSPSLPEHMRRMDLDGGNNAGRSQTNVATADSDRGLSNNRTRVVGSSSNEGPSVGSVTGFNSKWIARCLRVMEKDPPPFCSAAPAGDDMFFWNATIIGPPDSPYHGGIFKLKMRLPSDIPFHPPSVWFDTKVYHPNIDSSTGRIDLDILGGEWSIALTIATTLVSILSLLTDPNANEACAINSEAASLYRTDRLAYDERVRSWTLKYAT